MGQRPLGGGGGESQPWARTRGASAVTGLVPDPFSIPFVSLPSCARPAGALQGGAALAREGRQEPLSRPAREVHGFFWSWQRPGQCTAAPWSLRLHRWCCARAGLAAGSCRCCLGGSCTPWGPASMSHPGARDGTRGPWGACSRPPPAPAGRYHAPSPRRTGTKQVAKKWCRCVMSNLCIIKILFEQMSQEASGPVSQAGAAKFFWPSVAELGVSVLLAPAGVAALVREPCLPVGTEGRLVLPSPVGAQPCSRWFSMRGRRGLWEACGQPLHPVPCSSRAGCRWLPSGTRDTACCCVCAVGSCQEASEELEGWRVSVLGSREAESHGCQRVSVKQGRCQFSKQLLGAPACGTMRLIGSPSLPLQPLAPCPRGEW